MIGFLKQNVAPGSTIFTDGLKSFDGLKEAGYQHVPRIQPLRIELRKGAKSVVPLADRAIGNLQQWLIGTHHGVSREQLQVYLDEFVFRHNRRRLRWPPSRLCWASGAGASPHPTSRIRGAKDQPKHSSRRECSAAFHIRAARILKRIAIRHPKVINLPNFEMDTKKKRGSGGPFYYR